MNYNLNKIGNAQEKGKGLIDASKSLFLLLKGEGKTLLTSFVAIVINSGLSILGPFLIGYAIDKYVLKGDMHNVLVFSGILLLIYFVAFIANYIQIMLMGSLGQKIVFNLRNNIFHKIQELPIKFFNQNKAGDLISRINNDTDLLNQFFAQSLTRFVGILFGIIGSGVAIVIINFRLGTATLMPAVFLWIVTLSIGGILKARNKRSLQSIGSMSAEIQESLNNFKVIIAFNRRDYFREKFEEANENTFKANMRANVGNSVVTPMYDFAANAGQLIVLIYGIYLISHGNLTIGIMVSFLSYAERFYNPLRQLATLWTTFQLSLAAWDRVQEVLSLTSDLEVVKIENSEKNSDSIMKFENVSFTYDEGNDDNKEINERKYVLKNINLSLLAGKTYALVGPTGGGKTTTASLMARLFDPTSGTVRLHGRDIRSYEIGERAEKIGFILQEPFLFSGTVGENIFYGNNLKYEKSEREKVASEFKDLLLGFDEGLDTKIKGAGDGMSLGQKQIISFIRAIVRKPDILILDEATANIDTVTESLLQAILDKLPKTTTKVIIAHRLNTIADADEIFFVGGSAVTLAGSFEHAVEMLLHNKRGE